MKRDGQKRSIWQDGINLPQKNTPPDFYYDVIIIGGGITGVTTGVYLQEKGISCLIVDANSIGFGTTSGTSAHINSVLDVPYVDLINIHGLDKANKVARSTEHAIQDISDNIHKYGIDCDFVACRGYIYANNEEEANQLNKIKEGISQVGIEVCDTFEVPISGVPHSAIVFEGQAKFHPTKYLRGMLEVFNAAGGEIIVGEIIHTVETTDDGKQLVESGTGRRWYAKDVVYATHTPSGIRSMNFRLVPYRSYIQVYELDEDLKVEDLVYDMLEPFHYFRTVEIDDKKFLMVGGQDHKTGDHENEKYNFKELEAFVEQHYKIKNIRYEWSSQYYESQDYLPFIGYVSDEQKGEMIATGYGGNGMTYGTLAARILFELITTGKSKYEELYSPRRIGPLASFKKLVVENYDIAKKFIKGRLDVDTLEQFVEISRGEGKVVKYEGQKIGVFKDEAGKTHAVGAVCQHASCIVKWNNAEHSWDCPCHGARYGIAGELLNGPATGNLSPIDVHMKSQE